MLRCPANAMNHLGIASTYSHHVYVHNYIYMCACEIYIYIAIFSILNYTQTSYIYIYYTHVCVIVSDYSKVMITLGYFMKTVAVQLPLSSSPSPGWI